MAKLITDGPLELLLAYWRSKHSGRRLPALGDIDPVAIPDLLPHIQLVENLHGRFRYRLVGEAIVAAYGSNPTGRYMEEYLAADRCAFALRNYDIVAELRCPLATQCTFLLPGGARARTRRLLLPLIGDHGRVEVVLTGLAVEERPGAGELGLATNARIDAPAYALELVGAAR